MLPLNHRNIPSLQCRLPGSDGTWMVVRGGMGTITQRLAQAAMQAGANIQTGQGVQSISIRDGVAHGVQVPPTPGCHTLMLVTHTGLKAMSGSC